jgi:hypothetical protein
VLNKRQILYERQEQTDPQRMAFTQTHTGAGGASEGGCGGQTEQATEPRQVF